MQIRLEGKFVGQCPTHYFHIDIPNRIQTVPFKFFIFLFIFEQIKKVPFIVVINKISLLHMKFVIIQTSLRFSKDSLILQTFLKSIHVLQA